jgi:hypothetical protein
MIHEFVATLKNQVTEKSMSTRGPSDQTLTSELRNTSCRV